MNDRLDVVLVKEPVVGVHRREQVQQPLLLRGIRIDPFGSGTEQSVKWFAVGVHLRHLLHKFICNDTLAWRVSTVPETDLVCARQPEVALLHPYHKNDCHHLVLKTGDEELIALQGTVQSLLVVDK